MKKDTTNSLVKNTSKTSAKCEKQLPKAADREETNVDNSPKNKKKHSTAAKLLTTVAVIALGLALAPVFGTGIGVLIFGFCVLIPKVWNDEW